MPFRKVKGSIVKEAESFFPARFLRAICKCAPLFLQGKDTVQGGQPCVCACMRVCVLSISSFQRPCCQQAPAILPANLPPPLPPLPPLCVCPPSSAIWTLAEAASLLSHGPYNLQPTKAGWRRSLGHTEFEKASASTPRLPEMSQLSPSDHGRDLS